MRCYSSPSENQGDKVTNRCVTHTSWIHQIEGWFTLCVVQKGESGDFVVLLVMVQNLELRNYLLLSLHLIFFRLPLTVGNLNTVN